MKEGQMRPEGRGKERKGGDKKRRYVSSEQE